jgi:hypothetical protein
MVGLPEQPIENVTYDHVTGSSMETLLQDIGTVIFK